jgi:hypothetical protein
VSVPTGAVVAVQVATPADRFPVHRVVEPMVKATEPLGVPAAEEVTFAVYVTELPEAVEVGETVTEVVVFDVFAAAVTSNGAEKA